MNKDIINSLLLIASLELQGCGESSHIVNSIYKDFYELEPDFIGNKNLIYRYGNKYFRIAKEKGSLYDSDFEVYENGR